MKLSYASNRNGKLQSPLNFSSLNSFLHDPRPIMARAFQRSGSSKSILSLFVSLCSAKSDLVSSVFFVGLVCYFTLFKVSRMFSPRYTNRNYMGFLYSCCAYRNHVFWRYESIIYFLVWLENWFYLVFCQCPSYFMFGSFYVREVSPFWVVLIHTFYIPYN